MYITLPNNLILYLLIFVVSVILFAIAKTVLKKLQFGQVVRDDGPETHLKKRGTPTMAGIVFIIIFTVLCVIYKSKIILYMIIFGLIGFADDYIKVTKKNTKGLSSAFKFIAQIIVSYIVVVDLFKITPMSNIFMIFVLIFIIVGTDNGVNFTDGLDGLCTLVTVVVSIFYIFVAYKKGMSEYIPYNAIMLVMLIAFFIYNHFPAKLFMGDTGSLLIGGYVAIMAILLDVQFFLPIFGFIYMAEVLSVILQVSYFKMTHGKRIFKMAPIHHHFEKCGYSEVKIVTLFTLVTLVLCIVVYLIV